MEVEDVLTKEYASLKYLDPLLKEIEEAEAKSDFLAVEKPITSVCPITIVTVEVLHKRLIKQSTGRTAAGTGL